jgi:hypothetical protein
MLDTLQTVNRFKQLYSTVILGSGYEFKNFDYGLFFQVLDTMKSKTVCVLVVERILVRMIVARTSILLMDLMVKFKYGIWKMDGR